MKQSKQYFVLTGNPFVDTGIYALEAFYEKDFSSLTPDELKEKIYNIIDLYLKDDWNKNLYSIFTGNSKYTHNSNKKNPTKAKEKIRNYLNNLIEQFTFAENSGSCIACGKRNALPIKKRDEIPLIGSGNFINFFAAASGGERYCPVCTFAVQFVPLMLFSVSGRFLLFYSVSSKIMKYWAKEGMIRLQEQIASNNYTGCMHEGYKNGENALFFIVEKIVRDIDDIFTEENPAITAYIFSNYGQNPPPMQIIHLPNNVFRFLINIKRADFNVWRKIVKKGYSKIKNEDEYKWRNNKVYQNLLNNVPIINYFINNDKTVIGNWQIFSYYLKEVLEMEAKRIEIIKAVGDKIAEYIKTSNNTKRLFEIETAKTYEGLRNVFLKITKDMIKNNMDAPLFTFDEFVNDLFPEGALSWKETRDILLFRIYEQLSEYLKENDEIKEKISEEEE